MGQWIDYNEQITIIAGRVLNVCTSLIKLFT